MAPRQSLFNAARLGGRLEDYAEGAIVYLYLENFVTYDACEVYPGPYMNMLMGPNGTGKSSIVAAMALGLGWHPTVLGRSKDAGEFIKYGRERAVVETAMRVVELEVEEVELRDDGVIVLRRELSRGRSNSRHSSEWFINGQPASARVITQIMKVLNVQIDNLCQFLPQDKVSEFARLSPAELLLETEKAAAGNLIYEQHRQLIQWRNQERELLATMEESNKRLGSLLKQNENVEELVQRVQRREQHLKIIQLCEYKRPWLLYNAAREEYEELRGNIRKLRTQLDKAEESSNPIKGKLKEAQKRLGQAEQKRSKAADKADRLRAKLKNSIDVEASELAEEILKTKSQILRLREGRAKREATIADLKRTIRMLEEELRQGTPPDEDADPLRQELVAVNRAITEMEDEMSHAEEQVSRISRAGDRLTKEIEQSSGELRRLEDVRLQRLEGVRRMSPDVAETFTWIQANQGRFKEQPYGPICLDLNVKDSTLARHVESVISKTVLLNFVVTNDSDYEVFREACRANNWRSNVIIMESVDIERARTIVDRSQLKRLGFLGTILDIIDAPEPVLAALVDVAKVHLIPVAKGDVNPQEVESFQSITKYVAADGSYEIRRSQYSNDMAVRFMQLKVALFLGHSSSDDRKQALIERISERRVEMAANQERMKRLYQEQEKVRNRQVQLHKERESINEQRHALLAAVNEWKKKCQTLELKKSNVHRLTESNSQNDANKEEELKGELRNLFKQHAKLTIEGVKLSEEYCTLVMTMATENLSIVQVQSEVDRISEEVRTSEAQHEELRRTLSEAEASATELKQRCKDIAATADPNPPDEETAAVLAELPEGIEDLDRMLAVERARMEMADGSSIGNSTIREYEQRKRSITDLGQSLEKLERDQDGLRGQMDRLSAEWIPAVESMISLINERFSDFFALMGCAGQVRFAPKDRDYSDYALEILVKFRDIDSLQVLSAQRQSGGEKSVSTIIYLLALQELAKSPFRVVDEINQGMDAINERHVHALIVETATRAARSQYMMDIC